MAGALSEIDLRASSHQAKLRCPRQLVPHSSSYININGAKEAQKEVQTPGYTASSRQSSARPFTAENTTSPIALDLPIGRSTDVATESSPGSFPSEGPAATKTLISQFSFPTILTNHKDDKDNDQIPADRTDMTVEPSTLAPDQGTGNTDSDKYIPGFPSTTYPAVTALDSTGLPSNTAVDTTFPSSVFGSTSLGEFSQSQPHGELLPTSRVELYANAFTGVSVTDHSDRSSTMVNPVNSSSQMMKETSGAETFNLVSLSSDTSVPSLSLPQSTRNDLADSPSSTIDSSNSSWKDPTMDNTRTSKEISRQGSAAILGSVSGAGLVFTVILVFYRFFYQPFNKSPKKMLLASPRRESGPADERSYPQLSGGKEISRFSADS